MNKAKIVKEYDDRFKKKPNKWTNDERNEMCYQTIARFNTEPKSIFDVGCGNGHTLAYLADKFPNTKFFGLDPSQEALNLAHKNCSKAELHRAFLDDFVTNKKFDVVVNLGTAEHFEELLPNLKLIRNLVSDEGFCYFEAPHNLEYDFGDGSHSYRRLDYGSRQVEWHLDRAEWEDYLTQAGFVITEQISGAKPQWEFIWILKV